MTKYIYIEEMAHKPIKGKKEKYLIINKRYGKLLNYKYS